MKKIQDFGALIFPTFWTALMCGCFVYYSIDFKQVEQLEFALSLGLFCFSGYNMQRIWKMKLRIQQHRRSAYLLKKFAKPYLILTLISFGVGMYLFAPFSKNLRNDYLILAVFPILYVGYIYKSSVVKPLREYLILKNAVVAGVWLGFIYVLPHLVYSAEIIFYDGIKYFCFLFFLATSADAYDTKIDKSILRSIPMVTKNRLFVVLQLVLIAPMIYSFAWDWESLVVGLGLLLALFHSYFFRNQFFLGKIIFDALLGLLCMLN